MAEAWDIKTPNIRPTTHEGPVEFGDGVLKLLEIVPATDDTPAFPRTRKAYGPLAWEWAERKPEGV